MHSLEEGKAEAVQLDNLSDQLEAFFRELEDTQAACARMQREGATFREKLAQASDLSGELDQIEKMAKGVSEDLSRKTGQLDQIAASLKDLSNSLRRCFKLPIRQ